jgi:hypothetical protein
MHAFDSGSGRLDGEAFPLGVQVDAVDLLPDAGGHGRIGLVARAHLGDEVLHRAQHEEGELLFHAEGDALRGLLEDRDLVAGRNLGGERRAHGRAPRAPAGVSGSTERA